MKKSVVESIKEELLLLSEWLRGYSDAVALRNARHDYENVFLKSREDLTQLLHCPLEDASMLVLGCGYHYPEVILYSSVCKSVVGLDIIHSFYRDGFIQCLRDASTRRANMTLAVLKGLLRYWYYRYFRYLGNISGLRITHQEYRLLSYDGRHMPFEDESFDVVLSNAVLNEVANVDGLFEEIFRVTKGHGVSYHLWHNFYSFSGSYMPESVSLRYPWGHLRGKYRPRAALNKITPTEMRDLFSNYFELIGLYQVGEDHSKNDVGSSFRYERQDLLSESIRNELRAYPTELLLTRSYLIVGRKRD